MDYDGSNASLKNPTWWERRTNLERRAMVVVFLFFLAIIALIIGMVIILLQNHDKVSYEYYHNPNPSNYMMEPERDCDGPVKEREPICLEPGCVHAASEVLRYMDTSVNPCDDFYHFACGGFLNETHVPADQPYVDSFTSNFELLQTQLRAIIEEPQKNKDSKPFNLLRKLYHKCMDRNNIENDGLKTIKSTLRTLGGWPILDSYDWNEMQFDWKQTIYQFRRAGFDVNYFISLGVTVDLQNSSRYILELDQADLGMEEQFLVYGLEHEHVKNYFNFMVDIASIFGAEMPFALTELKAVLEFEIALARIAVNKNDIWNSTILYNPMKIVELQRRFPTIPWIEYINGVVDLSDFRVNFEDRIIVRVPQYITDFENLIRWTSKRVQANYLMWRAVKYSVDFLSEEVRDLRNKFYRAAFELTEVTSRWEECVFTVSTRLPFVMGSLYVEKYIAPEDKEVVFEMVAYIRNQFLEMLKGLDWMDDSTKLSAFDKIEAMSVYTAFSDELLSIQRLQKYYSSLDFNRNSYLSCIMNVDLFERDIYYRRLRQYVSINDWNVENYMIRVHPDFSPWANRLSIPNALLQGIFFSITRPQYLNYGALGYTIGHEIVHGFDETARQYNRNGYLLDWWSEHTKRAFIRKANCHNNYTMPEIDLLMNGMNRHVTSIGNQGGVKAAYFAYNRWVEGYGREFQLPSLSFYTPQQLFWVSAAQTHCVKYNHQFLKKNGLTEQKTPAYIEVLQTFSNVDLFARDFYCRTGSAMNPINKCVVW